MEFVHVKPSVEMGIIERTLLLVFFVIIVGSNSDGCGVDCGEGMVLTDISSLLERISSSFAVLLYVADSVMSLRSVRIEIISRALADVFVIIVGVEEGYEVDVGGGILVRDFPSSLTRV